MLQYWYFKDIGYKFGPCVYDDCHDILVIPFELKNFVILNVKGVDYRRILWSISWNEDINILNNSVLEDKGNL